VGGRQGLKVCIVRRDGAGKGGTIKAITERVSPRVFRVVALPAPTDRETQMYLQRYLGHLPAAGEVVIFDRSWYNRAGVERVMGFCSASKWTSFCRGARVRKGHGRVGIILIKYWLEVSAEEQTRRLQDRINDGRKLWKLSPMDLKSATRWDDYTQARDDMFQASDTAWAPWFMAHFQRQTSRPAEHHQPSAQPHSVQGHHPRPGGEAAQTRQDRQVQGRAYPFKVVEERF
jgi:polyphosphate kinase 2 (PPK2 family)